MEGIERKVETFLRLVGLSSDDKVDPATGLTEKQKKLVQSTWVPVKKDPIASGAAVMLVLFKKYPDYQQMFLAFKDVPVNELQGNKRFQAHCTSVISAFTNVIDTLHDPELMKASLIGLAERHKKRGQTQEQFLNLKDVILEVLAQKLGKQYTPEVSEAWNKTMDAAFSAMCEVLTS